MRQLEAGPCARQNSYSFLLLFDFVKYFLKQFTIVSDMHSPGTDIKEINIRFGLHASDIGGTWTHALQLF